MRRLVWADADAVARSAALARPAARARPEVVAGVRAILDDVAARGWPAVVDHAVRLDGAEPACVAVAPAAAAARRSLPADAVAAVALAARNIAAVHAGGLPAATAVETMPGLVCRRLWRPVDSVGLYVPGGATPLPSTLMMLALPAKAAGVDEIVVVTPPLPGGGLAPAVALAAEACGIASVWTVGGAQAIAALASGAGPLPRVAKICGPGNAWVAEAKAQAAARPGGPAIDMPAGPSELMVIADDSADPATVASDLLAQAEHDRDAQVILATPSARLADAVAAALERQCAALPRAAIAAASLAQGAILIVADLPEAVAIANAYAPEHLALALSDPDALLPAIRNAGAIFAGHHAAESFGDYLAGSSHVLPTDGAARAWSGVSTLSFAKAFSVQTATAAAAGAAAPATAALARLEGLEAHARAAERRIGDARAAA